MRRVFSLLMVSCLVWLSACGDDDESTAPPGTDSPTTTSTTMTPSVGDPSGDPDDPSRCAEMARSVAGRQALGSFPDNPDVSWSVADVTASEVRAIAEIVPTPDEVGYPRFRLVSMCEGDEIELLGAYALDGAGWILLFTAGDTQPEDLSPTLD
ncbi:MAG: hypothetical protein ACXIVQ_09805 [Acidimicrobiales bacterium]